MGVVNSASAGSFMIMAPGRGTTSSSASRCITEISNAAAMVEFTYPAGGFIPERPRAAISSRTWRVGHLLRGDLRSRPDVSFIRAGDRSAQPVTDLVPIWPACRMCRMWPVDGWCSTRYRLATGHLLLTGPAGRANHAARDSGIVACSLRDQQKRVCYIPRWARRQERPALCLIEASHVRWIPSASSARWSAMTTTKLPRHRWQFGYRPDL